MKSTLAKRISAALVVGMMAIGSVGPVSAQESIMGNPGDNDDSPYDGPRLYDYRFDGRYDRRFDRRFDRPFLSYNRPFLYDYDRPFSYGPRYGYRRHNFGNSIAAGILGFGLGAIIGGAINDRGVGYSSSHVSRCEARFRSYDRRTDSYMGYDGYRHRCNL
jgi:hypothetical protein